MFPVIPTIVTNAFASQSAGRPIDCQQFTPAASPPECQSAHAQVCLPCYCMCFVSMHTLPATCSCIGCRWSTTQAVRWNSVVSFVSATLLSSVCTPAVGRLSDSWGRRPFFLGGILTALVPMLVLAAHLHGWLPIQWCARELGT